MKNLSEMYKQEDYTTLSERINESKQIDEGLKDVINKVVDSIKKAADRVVDYVKTKVAQFGRVFLAIGADGVLPASTPMTAGAAYKDGIIDSTSTFVSLDSQASKIVGLKNKKLDALKLPAYKVKGLDYILMCENNTSNTSNINEAKLTHEDPDAIYNTIVATRDLVEEIKLHIQNKFLAPLIIFGAPGIGKTAILEQVVREMGSDYTLIVKTLSNETPDNFFLPTYVTKEADGKLSAADTSNSITTRATDVPKTWLPVYKKTGDEKADKIASDALGKGVLFIDELSRATSQVLNVCLPLLNEGRIGDGWYLGSGWTIIAASNRSEDDNEQNVGFFNNKTMLSRLDQVYYEPTVKSWEKWAKDQSFISPLLLQWLNMPASEEFSGGKFFYYDPDDQGERSTNGGILCNPRTWTNAMRKLACYSHTGKLEGFDILDIPEEKMKRILNGFIPATVVDQFMGFLKIIRSVGDWDRAVESVWNNAGKGLNIKKDDLRRIQTILIQQIICAHAGTLPTEKEFDSLCQWIVNCDSSQLASYMIDTFKAVYGVGKAGDYVINYRYEIANQPNPSDVNIINNRMKATLDKYGYTEDTYPDYFTDGKGKEGGLIRLIDAYGDTFEAYKVNGRDALG